MLCSWSVAAASIQMAQQPSCEPTPLGPATLRVLMCENFHHSCRRHVARVHLQPSGARVVTASTPSLFDTQPSAPARLQLSIAPPATACVHSAARVHGSDGSSVELMPGIEQDERANPNQFISAVIKPILTMVHRRHEATSVALSSVSWAEGMARASGRPVVDLGSSKCPLLLPTTYPSP